MNILLIEPPPLSKFGHPRVMGAIGTNKTDIASPPYGMMTISGILDKHGIPSLIVDANSERKSFNDIRELIIKEKAKMIVFSITIPTVFNDLLIAKIAKEVSKDILTVAIGPFAKYFHHKLLLENEFLDITVHSEDEPVILNIAKNNFNFKNILGISYRDQNGNIITNERQPDIENLDEMGFPSHNKISRTIYHDPTIQRTPFTMVMGTRGCYNNCTFCNQPYFWGKFRKRSIDHFIKELQWIIELKFKEIRFNDAGFTHDMEWADKLLDRMIAEKIDLTWGCEVRADKLNPKIIEKMKKAGCHSIHMGLETTDSEILKTIRKNITPAQIKEAVKNIKNAGMTAMVFFVLGLPGETKETMKTTIDFLKSLNADFITLGIATPMPGTDFYHYMKEKKLIKTYDWSKYDPMQKPVFDYPNLSGDEIYRTMFEGMRSFYLRPSYLVKRLKSIKTYHDFKTNLRGLISFIRQFLVTK
ncbi:MAG: hypothetical protein A2474_03975 [Elusimicrobia bacterium RIFOXYC2_FULL_34_12]|nr:MAG: hypothetical protein A2474_03975 [Elusimicrobia bacterium RIFOXYC2_FULL_34_12]HAM38254.1 hypothetical protein [Elusimicrobiota bacterium]